MATQDSLAGMSNLLMYSAMAVYTGALGAFALDLAGRGAAVRQVPAEVRAPATVGGPGGPAVAGTAAGDDAPPAVPPRRRNVVGIAIALTWLAFAAPPRRRRRPRRRCRARALGQHVRVRDGGRARGHRRLPRGPAPPRRALPRHLRRRPRAAHARPGDHRAVHAGRAARPGAAELLAGHPRLGRVHRLRAVHARVLHQRAAARPAPPGGGRAPPGRVPRGGRFMDALPAAAELERSRLPAARRGVPAVDVHRHRGRDLGRARLGPLLELGPQGGLVLRHLGRLRGLPARPGDPRLGRPRAPPGSPSPATAACCSTSSWSTSSSSASTRTPASDRRGAPEPVRRGSPRAGCRPWSWRAAGTGQAGEPWDRSSPSGPLPSWRRAGAGAPPPRAGDDARCRAGAGTRGRRRARAAGPPAPPAARAAGGHEHRTGPTTGTRTTRTRGRGAAAARSGPSLPAAVDERVDRDPDHHEDHNHAEQHAPHCTSVSPAGRGRAWTFRRLPTARSQEPERRDRTVIRP